MTTLNKIEAWFDRGVKENQAYLVVIVDTFDYDDYPAYAADDAACNELLAKNGQNMQRIMEVYDLRKDKESQLNEHRSWHVPAP